jgi:streptomycin 6-kinase
MVVPVETVPFEATPIDAYPSKQAWDAQATDLVATMLQRWHLTARAAYVGGEAGAVLPVTTTAGERAVLKVGYPHREAIWEAVGLQALGPLAPTVLRQDPWTWALLLEEVEPGIPLSRHAVSPREALETGARLYRDLSGCLAPRQLPTLDEVMRPFLDKAEAGSDIVAAGLATFGTLLDTGGSSFLHGDFNPGNVLLGDGRWRVIDPKPMRGDPTFDLWPLVSQLGDVWRGPHPETELAAQLEFTCAVAGIEPGRTARWAFARSALSVTWLRTDGNFAAADAAERETRAWKAVAGL